ncbi:phospholipase [Alcaligenaceae bacterium]|nr:phospholipase [Alcaligenaceae bacterium]
MNENALRLASYWRNSLADAESGKGGLRRTDIDKLIALPASSLKQGVLEKSDVDTFFLGESDDVQTVEVTLRPWVYQATLEHGQAPDKDKPEFVTPVVSLALLNRHGQLFSCSKTMVPRDILDPLTDGAFAIGSVEDLDTFLTANTHPQNTPPTDDAPVSEADYAKQWDEYLDYCSKVFQAVGQGWPVQQDQYVLTEHWYLYKEQIVQGASRHIVPLYDHMRRNRPDVPLFERFSALESPALEPNLSHNAGFSERLGHSNEKHALAPAQRDALSHLLCGVDGDILGVNGPPGTGKTTLLLSVVATLWAKAAIAGGEPPVIVASSTNNQAVTNIIDAFGKDFSAGAGVFSGRWLPDISSFGAYFPSKGKEKELGLIYQTRSFLEGKESTDYMDLATTTFLSKAKLAFPDQANLTLELVVKQLQDLIISKAKALELMASCWQALSRVKTAASKVLGQDPQAVLMTYRTAAKRMTLELERRQHSMLSFETYLAQESILYGLFSWLPPVAAKRLRLARLHVLGQGVSLNEQEHSIINSAGSVGEIEAALTQLLANAKQAVQVQQNNVVQAEQLIAQVQRSMADWVEAQSVLELPDGMRAQDMGLTDCDVLADTQIRFPIFLLTTHYWEGRWLLELQESLAEIQKSRGRNGRKAHESRWFRWMKLTPCIVSTFYMLPSALKGSRHNGTGFQDDYMYGLIDLLIVDEAGQVLPEVAGAAFALAKQALVIGDTLQIEPIWSIPMTVDIGNMASAGLLQGDRPDAVYEAICAGGKSAASGSVMRIAQQASRYHYDSDLERGMYLYEHRRCYDAIIEYCNDLCYHGKLQPKRGSKPDGGLPALGYLHIDGICQQPSGGSRHNPLEAQVIAQWIVAHRTELESRYGNMDISEIIGVVTPFSAQTREIIQACAEHGVAAGKGDKQITVGTVHSLQGAERPMVIFSAVYSKHADGGFIDSRSSMLNVAVSRAKDSFLVFADMDVFATVAVTQPRGLLANYLMQDPSNELQFELPPRADLQTARTGLSHLHGYAQHDAFLLDVLSQARREVHIVTPWILLDRIKDIGAWGAMIEAVQRGVSVNVYTDKELNTSGNHTHPDAFSTRLNELKTVVQALSEVGVSTKLVNKVHSKIVMADSSLLCIGSFNWFSASRAGNYVRDERSMAYQGPDVVDEIEVNKRSLASRLHPLHDK